jgi:hypothetical protein
VEDLRSQFDLDAITEEEWSFLLVAQDMSCTPACPRFSSRDELTWTPNEAYSGWNVYRGSLSVLRATETYTQPPGSNPAAMSFCGLLAPPLLDPYEPLPGDAAFYLVTSEADGNEGWLGAHSGGWPRPNTFPCP